MSAKVNLVTRLVSCSKEFEALQESWGRLYESSTRANIFVSWDWLFTWWSIFSQADERDLFILCFYDQNHLVGIAPFQIERKYPHAYIQGRTLRFLASGEHIEDSITTPFVDLLVKEGYEYAVMKTLEAKVLDYQQRWDFAEFDFLLQGSLIARCFQGGDTRVKQQTYHYGYRYQVPQYPDQASYLHSLPRRWQKDYRKKNRLLHKDGVMRLQSATVEDAEDALCLLKEMHHDRWSSRADFLIFDSPKFFEFHRQILHRLLPQGKAQLRTLYLDDQPLSSYYAFEDKGQVHYYQSAFFHEKANRYMPLFYMVCNEIGEAMKQGLRFDFMFDESSRSYKQQQYAAESTAMYRLVWTPSRYRLGLFSLYKSMKRAKDESRVCPTLLDNKPLLEKEVK